ncbi:hypothetical protein SLA2020_355970 [Shorea laevis]
MGFGMEAKADARRDTKKGRTYVDVVKNPLKEDSRKAKQQKVESVSSCEGDKVIVEVAKMDANSKVLDLEVDEKDYTWLDACTVRNVISPDITPSL